MPASTERSHEKPRRLVICLDGTGNEIYGGHLSNVIKLFRIIRKNENQRVFYNPGVGTIGQPGTWSRFKQKVREVAGLALGLGLDNNVLEAYSYLCRNYRKGDEIFIFGFSRGAHEARVLAGFIHMLGLLPEDQLNVCDYALTAYKRASEDDDLSQAWHFNRIMSGREVTIRFLGVWDTVASVIVPRRDRLYLPALEFLPYTRRNPSVQTFRHAMAVDERRRMFRLSDWKEPQQFIANPFLYGPHPKQDSRQVWFAGVHSDIGGGYPEKDSGLSKYPLLWMAMEAKRAGLQLNMDMVNRLAKGHRREDFNLQYEPPDPGAELHRSLKGAWYLIEPIPKSLKWRNWPRRWSVFKLYIPWAEPRAIPVNAIVHQSVFDRVNLKIGYRPINLPPNPIVEPHQE